MLEYEALGNLSVLGFTLSSIGFKFFRLTFKQYFSEKKDLFTDTLFALCACGVTFWYWIKVWQYGPWGIDCLLVLFIYFIGGWWPGVFMAIATALFERTFLPGAERSNQAKFIVIGLGSGLLGFILTLFPDFTYYRYFDRYPLAYEVQQTYIHFPTYQLKTICASASSRPSDELFPFTFTKAKRHLNIFTDVSVCSEEQINKNEHLLRYFWQEHINKLLKRKDIDSIDVYLKTKQNQKIYFSQDGRSPAHIKTNPEASDLKAQSIKPVTSKSMGRQQIYESEDKSRRVINSSSVEIFSVDNSK